MAAVTIDPEELVGCHVFEVGTREGIPFVTFGTGPRPAGRPDSSSSPATACLVWTRRHRCRRWRS